MWTQWRVTGGGAYGVLPLMQRTAWWYVEGTTYLGSISIAVMLYTETHSQALSHVSDVKLCGV